MKQKLIKLQGETDKSIILVRDFNTPLSIIDRPSRQKISKDVINFNNTINKFDLIDVYRTSNQQHCSPQI